MLSTMTGGAIGMTGGGGIGIGIVGGGAGTCIGIAAAVGIDKNAEYPLAVCAGASLPSDIFKSILACSRGSS